MHLMYCNYTRVAFDDSLTDLCLMNALLYNLLWAFKHHVPVHGSTNEVAELGHYPLQIRFCQHILKYHPRMLGMDGIQFGKLAILDGLRISECST